MGFKKWFGWIGLDSGVHPEGDRMGNLEELKMDSRKDHELYGTYIVVEPNTCMSDLIAIQDWIKEHPALTFMSMPVGDILGKANRDGKAFVSIDESGCVFSSNGPSSDWRRLDFIMKPTVSYYKVAPKTTCVNGKHYDNAELAKVLRQLEPKEMS